MKYVVRDEGDMHVFLFLYTSGSVVCLQVSRPHRDCTVGPVTSISTSPKFTEEESSLKIHTPLDRASWKKRSTKDQYINFDLVQKSEGGGSFRDIDGAWRDHSFQTTCLRLEELTINSAIFFCRFMLILIKLLKEKHENGRERCWFCGAVGRAPSAVIDAKP